MQIETRRPNLAAAVVAAVMLLSMFSILTQSQAAGETFTATATVKSPSASASSQVTIHIDRFMSDQARDKVVAVARKNDIAATRAALASMEDLGYIELGKRRTPIKYAYARPTGGGRLVTVVTAEPILFLGAGLPDAKPKEGFDLALALLVLNAQNTGDGELAPATRIKSSDTGGVVTDQYGAEVVRLTGVSKVK